MALQALYNKCFNFDGCLIGLAYHGATQERLVTEAIILLLLCQDKQLREVALANFLHENKLYHIVLESCDSKYLTLELNKQVTLRSYLKDESYRSLVKKLVEIVSLEDDDMSILLLDKISECERVLQVMLYK